MNSDEISCLGIDGHIYTIKRYAELKYDENGLPVRYEVPTLPSVPLIARSFASNDLENHPIRKARFKYLAAKEHNIVEKQRPQDVTIEEAYEMACAALMNCGYSENEAKQIVENYWM